MSAVLDASAIVGPVPTIIVVAGLAALAGLAGLLAHRRRHRHSAVVTLVTVVPVLAVAAVAGSAALGWVVNSWWRPFPDPLPFRVLAWDAIGLFAAGMTAAIWWAAPPPAAGRRTGGRRAGGWWPRVLAVPLLVVALILPAMKINAFYGYYPTVRAALGIPDANAIDLAELPTPPVTPATPGPAQPLITTWRPPPDMPATGRVARVEIPGTVSGFRPRAGSVYLPPAYLSAQRHPLLPVLVLIAGQPGSPQDWLVAGRLAQVMDRFAAAHAGLAPVVVLPDATGSTLANPLCLDSRLGRVETYLARDVPDWITTTLHTDPDPRRRAIGGFSYGGTCALQLAVRQPAVYPSFLDISGQAEPSLGRRDQTIAAAFGGDQGAYRAANPLDILAATTATTATTRFAASAGVIAIGRDDPDYGPQARTVYNATRRAGLTTQLLQVPGQHTWAVAIAGLDGALPWLAGRLGLTPPPA